MLLDKSNYIYACYILVLFTCCLRLMIYVFIDLIRFGTIEFFHKHKNEIFSLVLWALIGKGLLELMFYSAKNDLTARFILDLMCGALMYSLIETIVRFVNEMIIRLVKKLKRKNKSSC